MLEEVHYEEYYQLEALNDMEFLNINYPFYIESLPTL